MGCSLFVLDNTNPNDPLNIDVVGQELYPSYEKIYAKNIVYDTLNESYNTTKTYYYKFSDLTDLRIYIKINRYNYDKYYSVNLYNQNEVLVQRLSELEYSTESISINRDDYSGDYIVIEINNGNYSQLKYNIEVSGYK